MVESALPLRELAERPVTDLDGATGRVARSLAEVGIETVLDLLCYYPRRYLDRTREALIDSLVIGEENMVLVRVQKTSSRKIRSGRTLVEARVSDETGNLTAVFFNQPWRKEQLKENREAIFFGKVEQYKGRLQMTNPLVDLVGDRTGRIVAVYPQSEVARLNSWDVDRLVAEALRRVMKVRGFADPIPTNIRNRYRLFGRSKAFSGIHRPDSMAEVAESRKRLVFDELLRIQLELVERKKVFEMRELGVTHDGSCVLVDLFVSRLGFVLTTAQERVVSEIVQDMVRPVPMHRLLQGDVGSGKTVVAVAALLTSVQGGHQGALMTPTEVLAEQHYSSVLEMLSDLSLNDSTNLLGERPLVIRLLTSRTSATERRKIINDLSIGVVDILIGTHALIQESVDFNSLGVVVIDEQHRFGVEQRAALRDKNRNDVVPDVLVMTATPIPRTAAMTVYGDLDSSILDELPRGRSPVETFWEIQPESVWEVVRDEIAAGRQAYVVCPLIDESEILQVRSAEETFVSLSENELTGLRLGLLHGRVTRVEKEETMRLFRSGLLDVLIATTVIEVGVDVPNATVMVILDAARFGIAQLHQLRGRVGRGEHVSRCFLVGEAPTAIAEERLLAVVGTTDGFELAEVDLDLRGEGTVMGGKQKGRNDLMLASLRRDREWVGVARDVALELISHGKGLDDYPQLADEVQLFLGGEKAGYLLKS